MNLINPFESGVAQLVKESESNVGYSASGKANSGLFWAVFAAALFLLGFVIPQITIIFVLIICGISAYYTKGAKKEGSTSLKKIKAATIISTTVTIVSILAFIINIVSLGLQK